MAEINRVSGRQAASTSGRQAPASVSGRAAAPSPSGRNIPAAAPAPAPRSASSARMAPASSTSGRATSASGRAAPPPPAPARASARKSAGGRARGEEGGGKKKKQRPMGGKELLIAFAGIAILAGIAIMYAVRNSNRQKAATASKVAKEEAERLNYEAAEKIYRLAEEKGYMLLVGKEEFNEAKHFGGFKSDPSVYNVIYERRSKDKKGNEKPAHHAMYPDKLSFVKTGYGTEKEGLRINYALADGKATNVVMAVKSIKIPEGDTLTVSAQLTIIVKAAAEDPKFDLARNAQTPQEMQAKEKEPAKDKDAK